VKTTRIAVYLALLIPSWFLFALVWHWRFSGVWFYGWDTGTGLRDFLPGYSHSKLCDPDHFYVPVWWIAAMWIDFWISVFAFPAVLITLWTRIQKAFTKGRPPKAEPPAKRSGGPGR
jgi:hypothetical protein